MIPGALTASFNFRFASVSTPDALKARLEAVLDRHNLEHRIDWNLGGDPYLTQVGTLCDAMRFAISSVTAVETALSTSGGTSDGRFIAKHCREVIEFGPPNATIHQVDESIALDEIDQLHLIYRALISRLLIELPHQQSNDSKAA